MTNPRTWITTGLFVVLMATADAWSDRPAARDIAGLSTPEITNVTPGSPGVSSKPQRLTITGTDFLEGLTLMITNPGGQSQRYAGADILNRRPTAFEVNVLLDEKGSYSLVVSNTDGGVSRPFPLTAQAGAAQSENKTKPTIESISPAKVTKSNTPQTLTVRGTRFEPGMVVLLTDPTGTVKTISGNAIADITPTSFQFTAILELPGEYSVEVKLPSGALSNTAVVTAE
jgi:IPT/TIG domain-containing protein